LIESVQENTYRYRTAIYLSAGATAEFFADIALSPWEAVKVRIQTQENWATNLREGMPKLYGII
jgi:solute carrier family 25 phosphate transporter 3